ncbi:MAG TPA: tetraacyldisaccharide 4'-kinase [Verrucomicrobiae bacterium]|nr:tetraacyldisaccharide 4'-kinase [Verrucomicrobiae bacterium]
MSARIRNFVRLLTEDKIRGPFSGILYSLASFFSGLYAYAAGVRKNFFDQKVWKSEKLPFPVISVGNLTWGGSGKTPLVEYLAYRINELQKRALVLTRGYSHDEIVQYKEHLPHVLIGVGKNRVQTAQKILQQHKVDLGILDDGFQHWPIERDIDVVTVNSLNPFGNELLIPRGPLREPIVALKRAHIVVLTHVNLVKPEELDALRLRVKELAPEAAVVESFLEPLFFYRGQKKQRIPLERLQNQKVTTFSGVGVPRSFQLILAQRQIRAVRNFEFTDHYRFTRRDLEEVKYVSEAAASQEIITTEKDFYRAPDMIAKVLNPLVLATRLRIASGEDILTGALSRLLGASV